MQKNGFRVCLAKKIDPIFNKANNNHKKSKHPLVFAVNMAYNLPFKY